ncbi:MAG TPA: signal recognition particle-docking protein FtsY [Rhizobiales bacterium]|jgi:fused signal recognition particle receptor|nr:signal recognition particle-docking protein FtsY [Hyphomicrobiales bacterium]HCL62946.1 signal recognition particle-docking protein FtsY [Hyphomicrobiales bacterium]
MSEGNKPSFFQRLLGLGDDKPKPEEPTPPPKKEPPSEAPQRKPPEKTPAKEEPERERLPKTANAKPAPRRKPHPAPGVSETKAKPKTSLPLEPKRSWFAELRHGLSRTSTALSDNIASVLTKRKLDEETLDRLEEVLIKADLGVAMAARMRAAIAKGRYERGLTPEAVREVLAAEIASVLEPVAQPFALSTARPHVFLVVGVNGTGKTTTIGKMAHQFRRRGLSVMLAAADTFRAAAIDQLKVWGSRVGAEVVAKDAGSDPAGVAYEALVRARTEACDVLLIDTAGRLQNKTDLMAELAKIVRVLKKLDASAPHGVILVLDATTGQNALNQVQIFQEIAGVTGLVVTKLDGTARGGILVAIAERFGLPINAIGIGEGLEDFEPFDAGDFARAIAGVGSENEAAA